MQRRQAIGGAGSGTNGVAANDNTSDVPLKMLAIPTTDFGQCQTSLSP
jgi:hypothetical protein